MTVIVVRPTADAQAVCAYLAQDGISALPAPVSRIIPVDRPQPEDKAYQAVLATSANALAQPVPKGLTALPLFAVGKKTAEAARTSGFGQVHVGGGNAYALTKQIMGQCRAQDGPLLYLAGEPRKPVLEDRLAHGGFTVRAWLRYRAEALSGLSPPVLTALTTGPVTILLYSERSASLFFALAQAQGVDFAQVSALCISQAVATCAHAHHIKTHTASEPTQEGLLSTLPNSLNSCCLKLQG